MNRIELAANSQTNTLEPMEFGSNTAPVLTAAAVVGVVVVLFAAGVASDAVESIEEDPVDPRGSLTSGSDASQLVDVRSNALS